MRSGLHEDLHRRDEVEGSSNRAFGVTFTAVFAIIGLWPLLGWEAPRWWSLVVALAFGLAAAFRPRLLAPLNRIWFRFGLLLHRVVNPVVLGILFFAVITPIAALMRLAGRKPLQRRIEPEAASYWIPRDPPGPAPETMRNQF